MEKKKREQKRKKNLVTVWLVAILFIAGSLLSYNFDLKKRKRQGLIIR